MIKKKMTMKAIRFFEIKTNKNQIIQIEGNKYNKNRKKVK